MQFPDLSNFGCLPGKAGGTPAYAREELAKSLYDVSLETLESYAPRAQKFGRGVGNSKNIRGQLYKYGYTQALHRRVFDLIKIAYDIPLFADTDVFDSKTIEAIAFCGSHDELLFTMIDASLAPRMPEQATFLTQGLRPSTGMSSVVVTSMILDRMNKMETGPERRSTRKEDQAALELLASRGITSELRAKLAEAVKVATSATRVEESDQAELAAADEKYVRALGEIKAWYEEWSRVARVVVKRRDPSLPVASELRMTAWPRIRSVCGRGRRG